MTNNRVEQKPSETALFAALRRTLANKEFNNERFGPDNLAIHFLPANFRFFLKFKRVRANTKDRLDDVLPGLYEYMIARTAYFDRLFLDALKDKTAQIVLLGAGYDTRAYRFARENHGTRIFELDIPPTQERKKECIKKARIDVPEQVRFVPIDFNQESLIDVLEKGGYRSDLEFVSQDSHPESAIGFDYTISISEGNINNYYGVKEFVGSMNEHHASEELMFSIDEGETESFLERRGLKMVDHLDNEEIERTFLLQEDGSPLGQITGHFHFVLASAKKQPE
jgi:O-methyltransferase involved in polyketide biosynthesis